MQMPKRAPGRGSDVLRMSQAARANLERDAETAGYSHAAAAPGGAADVTLNHPDAELDFGEGRSQSQDGSAGASACPERHSRQARDKQSGHN